MVLSNFWRLFFIAGASILQLTCADNSQQSERHPKRHNRQNTRTSRPDWTAFHQKMPLRPSPVMIPLDIQESPNKDLDPDLESLDEYELLTLLGSDYDRQFMSLRKPLDMILNPNGTLHYQFKKDQTPSESKMPSEIAALSAREIALSSDGPPLKVKFKKRTKSKIQKFLWAYSYCPVRYKWKTLSIRFWPQWIKTGACDNQRSCSIPAGMTCQPTKMKNIRILRYYCPIPGSKQSCQWIKFDYPILEQCSCMCDNSQQPGPYS
ncbi:noggin-2-like [Watersipora subatra]|uniref:noggin-2-like n=1 Tax=Watersipora subatra TaxID=2589382 RepID=UPI00355C2965